MPAAAFRCDHCGKTILEEEGACGSCRVRVAVPDDVRPLDAVLWGVSAATAIVVALILMV
jgi:hypothetical protein